MPSTKTLGVVGAMFASVCASIYYAPHLSRLLSDFYGNVWWPGKRIYYGAAGFPDTHTEWPATATAALSPFALVPEWAAVALWVTASIACLGGALWLIGCRDLRAYAVALASPPVLCCLVLGNMTLMLVAGIAVVWVARDRCPGLAGSSPGALVVMNGWVWPVAVFLLLTRRFLAASTAAVVLVAGTFAWWILSPDTLYAYDDRTRETVEAFGPFGMGVVSITMNEGATVAVAEVVAFAAGTAVLIIAWRATGDVVRLTLCLAAALLASPIVWAHYYAILLVPIAIRSPRFSGLWLVPYLTIGALVGPTLHLEFIVASAFSLAALAIVSVHIASPTSTRSAARSTEAAATFEP
jgi:hypothetical protein